MDQLVTHVVPVVLLLLGLSYLVAADHWIAYAREILEAPHRFLVAALGLATAGLVIVVARNWWHPSLGVVITIFGWLLLLKGAAFLLVPGVMGGKFARWPEGAMKTAARGGGLLLTILGAVLTYVVWFAA